MTARKQILIVEDEPLIAMMLEDFLDVLDQDVAGSADSVATALERVEQGGLDAAILDVNLRGGEKSFAIAEALAAKNIPFVFASGGGGEDIAPEYRDRPMLPKPYTMEGVEQALAKLA